MSHQSIPDTASPVYVYASASVSESPPFVTVTDTTPALCVGVTHSISLSLSTVQVVHSVPSISTLVAPVKPEPVMLIVSPPLSTPLSGCTPVTAGSPVHVGFTAPGVPLSPAGRSNPDGVAHQFAPLSLSVPLSTFASRFSEAPVGTLGHPPPPSQTPAEFQSSFLTQLDQWERHPRLARLLSGVRPGVERLTTLFIARQYSLGRSAAARAEARRLWRQMARRLWLLRFVRFFLRH